MLLQDILKEKTLCFTGHRPHSMFGYDEKDPRNVVLIEAIKKKVIEAIEVHGITTFITGMALGVDTWAAKVVLSLKRTYPHIKLVAALPCRSQWKKWKSPESRLTWKRITDRCDVVHLVTETEYTPSCMQLRNIWMADHSCRAIAVYNNSGSGGTYNCISYLKSKGTHVDYINPDEIQTSEV